MRKIFVLFIGLIGLGVVMSGCVANGYRTTKVKDAYIQKNYINKVKVPKSKKVGDRNIKFYVGKVVDKRKDKAVHVKRTYFNIRTGDTELADTQKTIKNITKKALLNTGWGIADNKNSADFVVDTMVYRFKNEQGILFFWNVAKSNICVLTVKNKKILHKNIYEEKRGAFFMQPDFTMRFRFTAGEVARVYYKALLDYFSSPEFVKAIKKAYFKLLSEGN